MTELDLQVADSLRKLLETDPVIAACVKEAEGLAEQMELLRHCIEDQTKLKSQSLILRNFFVLRLQTLMNVIWPVFPVLLDLGIVQEEVDDVANSVEIDHLIFLGILNFREPVDALDHVALLHDSVELFNR